MPTRHNFCGSRARWYPSQRALTVVLLAIGLYLALFVAPADYQQGETVRIMYLHVPSALDVHVRLSGDVGCGDRHAGLPPSARRCGAKGAAPLGAGFTFLCLTTGSLWGKPEWGTWWVWDARLTSVLVLFLIYLGILALWQVIETPVKPRALSPFSRSSARSTFRSSNSRSNGGIHCTNRRRSSAWAARPLPPRCSRRC